MAWSLDRLQKALELGTRKGVAAAAVHLQNSIKNKLSQYPTGRDQKTIAPPGGPPGVRTGELRRHVQYDPTGLTGSRPYALVGMSKLKYARIQEYGGYVPGGASPAPVSKKIPVPLNTAAIRLLRQAGAAGLRSTGSKMRFFKSKAGDTIMAQVGGKARFVLKDYVHIPARPYFRPTAKEQRQAMRDKISEQIRAAMRGH